MTAEARPPAKLATAEVKPPAQLATAEAMPPSHRLTSKQPAPRRSSIDIEEEAYQRLIAKGPKNRSAAPKRTSAAPKHAALKRPSAAADAARARPVRVNPKTHVVDLGIQVQWDAHERGSYNAYTSRYWKRARYLLDQMQITSEVQRTATLKHVRDKACKLWIKHNE